MLSLLLILPEGKTAVERSCLGQWQRRWGSSHLVLKGLERPRTPRNSQAHQAGTPSEEWDTRGVDDRRIWMRAGGVERRPAGQGPSDGAESCKESERKVRCVQRAATDDVGPKVSAGTPGSPRGRRPATADFAVGTELLRARAVLLRGCVWCVGCTHVGSPGPGPCLQLSAERGMVPRAGRGVLGESGQATPMHRCSEPVRQGRGC